MLLADAHVEEPLRKRPRERGEPRPVAHGRRQRADPRIRAGGLHQRLPEHLAPARGRRRLEIRMRGVERPHAVPRRGVRLRRREPPALARHDMDGHAPLVGPRDGERPLQRGDIVPVHGTDIPQPQRLEERIPQQHRLQRPLDAVVEPAQEREVGPVPHPLQDRLRAVVADAREEPPQDPRARPHVPRDGHRVVVDDEDELPLQVPAVVEGLQRHPVRERRVADDRDDLLVAPLQVTGRRHALGHRKRIPRMARHKGVARRLLRIAEAREAVQLADRPHPRTASREDLPGVGLVSHIPDDPVVRGIEDAQEADHELHRAERTREVATRPGDGRDDLAAHEPRQFGQLGLREAAHVGRLAHGVKRNAHACPPIRRSRRA